jgi:hypothetical protein
VGTVEEEKQKPTAHGALCNTVFKEITYRICAQQNSKSYIVLYPPTCIGDNAPTNVGEEDFKTYMTGLFGN